MTKQRVDTHSTEFGIWLRQQEPIDSKKGYVATNIDYLWRNYKTGKWMLIEEKRYGTQVKFPQSELLKILDKVSQNDSMYKGLFVIVFENTSPDDGKIWIDGKEVTKEDLLKFLQFDFSYSVSADDSL
jgi:hypothetical protein